MPVLKNDKRGEFSSLKIEVVKPINIHNDNIIPSKDLKSNNLRNQHKNDDEGSDISEGVIDEIQDFSSIFPNLETKIYVLTSKHSLIYLLGTDHANSQCPKDVSNVIRYVKPNAVVVELCPFRACGCPKHLGNIFQTTPEFSFSYLKKATRQIGFIPGFIFLTDVYREYHVSGQNIFLDYGGELIAAIIEAKRTGNCEIMLGDRPIDVTIKRQASLLSYWRKIRLVIQVTIGLLFTRWRKSLFLDASSLVFNDPGTYRVLVYERDLFLTNSIQTAANKRRNSNPRIVAVVGQGHMQGIIKYWGHVSPDILPLLLSTNVQ